MRLLILALALMATNRSHAANLSENEITQVVSSRFLKDYVNRSNQLRQSAQQLRFLRECRLAKEKGYRYGEWATYGLLLELAANDPKYKTDPCLATFNQFNQEKLVLEHNLNDLSPFLNLPKLERITIAGKEVSIEQIGKLVALGTMWGDQNSHWTHRLKQLENPTSKVAKVGRKIAGNEVVRSLHKLPLHRRLHPVPRKYREFDRKCRMILRQEPEDDTFDARKTVIRRIMEQSDVALRSVRSFARVFFFLSTDYILCWTTALRLRDLTSLNLSGLGLNLKDGDLEILGSLPHLRDLNLSHNNISGTDWLTPKLQERLRSLNLRQNNISEVEIAKAKEMEVLDLSRNLLTQVDLGQLDQLTDLDLSHNPLGGPLEPGHLMDANIILPKNLKKLAMASCDLRHSRRILEGLKALEVLDLRGNQLTTFSWRSKTLKELSLADNQIAAFAWKKSSGVNHPSGRYPASIKRRFEGLHKLDVSGNALTSLDGFRGSQIKQLHIDDNQVTSLAGLDTLKKLHTLSATNNLIRLAPEIHKRDIAVELGGNPLRYHPPSQALSQEYEGWKLNDTVGAAMAAKNSQEVGPSVQRDIHESPLFQSRPTWQRGDFTDKLSFASLAKGHSNSTAWWLHRMEDRRDPMEDNLDNLMSAAKASRDLLDYVMILIWARHAPYPIEKGEFGALVEISLGQLMHVGAIGFTYRELGRLRRHIIELHSEGKGWIDEEPYDSLMMALAGLAARLNQDYLDTKERVSQNENAVKDLDTRLNALKAKVDSLEQTMTNDQKRRAVLSIVGIGLGLVGGSGTVEAIAALTTIVELSWAGAEVVSAVTEEGATHMDGRSAEIMGQVSQATGAFAGGLSNLL